MLFRFLDPDSGQPIGLRPPDQSDVTRLRAVESGPVVSILVATTPGPGIDADDLFRIAAMLADVERRLRLELGAREAVALSDRCRGLVIDLIEEPMGRGIAMFVAPGVAEAFRLDHVPIERVVVDPNFATRELEFAARNTARCRILTLDRSGARFHLSSGETVLERQNQVFPLHARDLDDLARHLGHVVEGIEGDRDVAGLPLVLIGPRALIAWIGDRVPVAPIGLIDNDGASIDAPTLATLAGSVLCSQLTRERELAFRLLDDALVDGSAVVGLDEVWRAVCGGRVDVVLVDPTLARGGTLDPVTHEVRWVDDSSTPGVFDDLVDEMIELTALSGGAVVFVEPGSLGDDGVAAVVGERTLCVRLDRLAVA